MERLALGMGMTLALNVGFIAPQPILYHSSNTALQNNLYGTIIGIGDSYII